MNWTERNQILVGGIVLVLVAGSVGFWLGRSQAPTQGTPQPQSPTANLEGGIRASNLRDDRITTSDQDPGMYVLVGSFALAKDGWVVVHEDSLGSPGNILGARRFAAGTYENGLVELLRATEPNKTYYAMLHRDDGDRLFDHSKDLPVPAADGSLVMARFATTR